MAVPALATRAGTGRLAPLRHARNAVLAAEILVAYARCRRLKARHDLPGALARLRPRTGGTPGTRDDVAAGLRLGRATSRLLHAVPADDRCLTRALVLIRLLDRRGIGGVLVIGVRSEEAFAAHAWVEIAGHPVLESGGDRYLRLTEL